MVNLPTGASNAHRPPPACSLRRHARAFGHRAGRYADDGQDRIVPSTTGTVLIAPDPARGTVTLLRHVRRARAGPAERGTPARADGGGGELWPVPLKQFKTYNSVYCVLHDMYWLKLNDRVYSLRKPTFLGRTDMTVPVALRAIVRHQKDCPGCGGARRVPTLRHPDRQSFWSICPVCAGRDEVSSSAALSVAPGRTLARRNAVSAP
jgi:hypothetical protein